MGNRRSTASPPPDHNHSHQHGLGRMGPRPLPLHLMSHAAILWSSHAALTSLKDGSLPWKPNLAGEAESLRQSLDAAGPEAWTLLEQAVTAEAALRHDAMLAGIAAYRRHPYARDLAPPPELWRQGTTCLLDYREPDREGGLPVLVIPSLVNRAYILDLTARRSLMRDFARRGLAPFLVDWDAPGAEEMGFSLDEYIAGRLSGALDAVIGATGRKPAVVGYCMGGDLALALTCLHPDKVGALALMATPWDFHADGRGHGELMRAMADPLGALIHAAGQAPVDMINAMFASLDANLASRKFAAFTRLKRRSARARDFVALEDWANDGVPLAPEVARQCLFGWYGDNDTARGKWSVSGRPVLPESVRAPTLVMVPERDRIVPPQSSLPLGQRIPGAKLMRVRGGHVGMLLSARAKTDVYAPLAKWLVRSALQ